MWFGYNPQIIFCHFFCKLNLAIFQALSWTMWMGRGYLVCATPPTVLYWFFWNFTSVLIMVWQYACGLDTTIRLFLSLFLQVELSHISSIIYNKVNGQGIPCGRNSSYSFIPILSKRHWSWSEDMHVVWIVTSDLFYHIKPQFKDYHFSSIFPLHCINIINVHIYVVPLSANAPTNYTILYETSLCAYVMAWTYGYALDRILKFCFCFLFFEL